MSIKVKREILHWFYEKFNFLRNSAKAVKIGSHFTKVSAIM